MSDEQLWIDAEGGYALALDPVAGKLACRNKKGKVLASVPPKVRKGEAAQELLALRDWLKEHRAECKASAEEWLLRSLPVPRDVLASVWADDAWRAVLENAVIAPVRAGELELDRGGFFKGVTERGVGVVTLDGETEWLEADEVALPHPILLPELEDYRELASELELNQGLSQLFRETFSRAEDVDPEQRQVRDFAGGEFEELRFAGGRARGLSYRVRGGYALCDVFEQGRTVEARFWIGAGEGWENTWTGELLWVDEEEEAIAVSALGPVAYSEGVRMASLIYAGRKVESKGEED